MQNKVYLDFQIIDNCSKDERYRKHFLESSDNEYYLSVNHFEELYRAKKNANTDKNQKYANNLFCFMKKFCNEFIINPSANGVILKKTIF